MNHQEVAQYLDFSPMNGKGLAKISRQNRAWRSKQRAASLAEAVNQVNRFMDERPFRAASLLSRMLRHQMGNGPKPGRVTKKRNSQDFP